MPNTSPIPPTLLALLLARQEQATAQAQATATTKAGRADGFISACRLMVDAPLSEWDGEPLRLADLPISARGRVLAALRDGLTWDGAGRKGADGRMPAPGDPGVLTLKGHDRPLTVIAVPAMDADGKPLDPARWTLEATPALFAVEMAKATE